MVMLTIYDFGVKKYLSENANGYFKTSKKDAKIFENKQEALKVKITLLNKEDFFIEPLN